MKKEFDLAVYIGRFQPYHLGHHAVIEEALTIANKVAVIIGSANNSRSLRNPFTEKERELMIKKSFSDEDSSRLFFSYIEDTIYNDEFWVKNVQNAVTNVLSQAYGGFHPMAKITLIGHNKDNTSFYLKLFPQWANNDTKNYLALSATDIREKYFGYFKESPTEKEVTPFVYDYLKEFKKTAAFENLCDEKKFIKKYKESWSCAPFPPVFVTVDSIVIQSGHILLVRRGAKPGFGLWALPGGFIDQNEKLIDSAIRELKEETKIKIPIPVLKGSLIKKEVFDDPHRSMRGRTITHAFLFHISANKELPKIKGSDDASDAKWFPLSEVTRKMMFEDHYDIILNMTSEI